MKEEGVAVKEERGNRIFPVSNKSQDVLKAFEKMLNKKNVKVKTNIKVKEILVNQQQKVEGVLLENGTKIVADKVILATGGKSYANTGSTGDGYEIAKKIGHTINPVKPSIVPLAVQGESLEMCKQMQGLSLRNVGIKIQDNENKKIIYEDFGEMLFTHFGVSGPTILSSSAVILRYKNIEEKMKNSSIILKIDLKPALTAQKLELRIQRDFEKFKNKEIRNALIELLPKKMIIPVLKLAQIREEKLVNSITKEERRKIEKVLK